MKFFQKKDVTLKSLKLIEIQLVKRPIGVIFQARFIETISVSLSLTNQPIRFEE